jgi:hypothetical protein
LEKWVGITTMKNFNTKITKGIHKVHKRKFCALCVVFVSFVVKKFPGFLIALFLTVPVFSRDWYLSNPSGMAIERSPSQMTALRADWSVSVEPAERSALPDILRPYYETGFSIELRVLYNRGKPVRRQWIFRSGSITRLNASLPAEESRETAGEKTSGTEQPVEKRPEDETGQPEDGAERPEDGAARPAADHKEARLPFIELYSPDYQLAELFQILASGERYSTRYRYSGGVLVASETRLGEELLWSDEYRYTRNHKLRGVERRYAEKKVPEKESAGEEDSRLVRLSFPPQGVSFISPESPYDYRLRTGALREVFVTEALTVRYSTDEQGRVIHEEHLDGEGKQIASLVNEWSGDKLLSVTWNTDDVSGKVEFDYTQNGENGGERNYRNGVLERKVTRDGNRELEELYRNGRPILRAVWEDGRKIAEERL